MVGSLNEGEKQDGVVVAVGSEDNKNNLPMKTGMWQPYFHVFGVSV